MKRITARYAALHGVPPGTFTRSPYRIAGADPIVEVCAAERHGCHVELIRPDGRRLLVDASHELMRP